MVTQTSSRAERLGIKPEEINRATGRHQATESLEAAHKLYLNSQDNERTKAWARAELERWLRKELKKTKTQETYRLLFGQTPEDSRVILEVIVGWDRATRTRLTNYRGKRSKSAKEVRAILENARPASYEWFSALDTFEKALTRDMIKAKKNREVSLMFDLLEILRPGKDREQIEGLLIGRVKRFEDQQRLLPMLSGERRTKFIVRMSRLI